MPIACSALQRDAAPPATSPMNALSVISSFRLRRRPGPVSRSIASICAGELDVGELPARHVDADRRPAPRRRTAAATPPSAGTTRRASRRPIGRIIPVSSATAMNSTGPTSPRTGCRQRTSASNAGDAAALELDDRLVVRRRTPRSSIGVPQVGLDLQARDRAVAHRRIEELAARGAVDLGAMERDRRVAQDLLRPRRSRSVLTAMPTLADVKTWWPSTSNGFSSARAQPLGDARPRRSHRRCRRAAP